MSTLSWPPRLAAGWAALALLAAALIPSSVSAAPPTLGFTSGTLPLGLAGAKYLGTLGVTGGTSPYSISLVGGTLPAGLSLNASTGVISGTPGAATAASELTFQVIDAGSPAQRASQTFSLGIAPATLVFTNQGLPGGRVGAAYTTTLGAAGGSAPYHWSLIGGTLPAGLSLNSSTGVVSGTPTVTVMGAPLTFRITDSAAAPQSASVTLSLDIAAATLAFSKTQLPAGRVGLPFTATATATGGTGAYSWSIANGTLPAGLSLDAASGAISGTPTAAVTSAVTFKVTDSGSPAQSASMTLTVMIGPSTLSTITITLPAVHVGSAYLATLLATGGTLPYSWSIAAGALPAGLSLNASTGVISGTPTAGAASSVTFKVTDSGGGAAQSASVTLSFGSGPAVLTVTSRVLTEGRLGVAYSSALAASGGTAPYHWSIASGTLPAGLSLNASTGALSGTPTAARSALEVTFQVSDSGSPAQQASITLSLGVAPAPLGLNNLGVPTGRVSSAYSGALAATGGTGPYSWSVIGGSLPAGLTLNAASGAITGTPTAAVAGSAVTFQVTDSANPVQRASLTLSVSIAPATLVFTSLQARGGRVGVAFIGTLAAKGGTGPYTFQVMSGSSLPAGLSLNPSTGIISGTPTARVTASEVTFGVTDSEAPAQSATSTLTLSIAPSTLIITTASLPSGQLSVPYSMTPDVAGGTAPYHWSLVAGTLPAGLSFNTASGAITGTPTATVNGAALTFQVIDSGGTVAQSASATFFLTVNSGTVIVTLAPRRAAVTARVGQTFVATVTGTSNTAVTWSVDGVAGGNSTVGTISAGGAYTPPSTAGTHTVKATSVANTGVSASSSVAVTDLSGVLTQRYDNARDGQNLQEYALTAAVLSTSGAFGKLFTCAVSGSVYAQPLYVANLSIAGGTHNVLFVATQQNIVYAFDADASSCTTYWTVNLDPAGSTPTPNSGNQGDEDVAGPYGIIGTPVIDLSGGVLYTVASTLDNGTTFNYRLHALDLATGAEKTASPAVISASVSGATFDASVQMQRPGLLLSGGTVYIAFGSYGDANTYYGWLIGYDKTALTRTAAFNSAPNSSDPMGAGIWMAGAGPAADSSGNIYFSTANGPFNVTALPPLAPNDNFGDTLVKLKSTLTVADYFTPMTQAYLESGDLDFGSAGVMILPDAAGSTTHPHLAVASDKESILYLVDRDSMGEYNSVANNNLQSVLVNGFGNTSGTGFFSTSSYWNGNVYVGAEGDNVKIYPISGAVLASSPAAQSAEIYQYPGVNPVISAAGASATSAIAWVVDTSANGTNGAATGPAILRAYDATSLGSALWSSGTLSADTCGNAVKFVVPTVANGKVYVAGANQLTVYGLQP